MRATDIIRGVLDLIDRVDCAQTPEPEIAVVAKPVEEPVVQTGDDTRFKHIFAMLGAERANPGMYDNSPNNTTAGLDAVTKDASGGLNGPKNPADIRSNSVSMYPGYQAENKG
jgi:hypothetical protein